MTLTFCIHKSLYTHLVEYIYQILHQNLHQFPSTLMLSHVPYKSTTKTDLTLPLKVRVNEGRRLNNICRFLFFLGFLGSDAAYQVSRPSMTGSRGEEFLSYILA